MIADPGTMFPGKPPSRLLNKEAGSMRTKSSCPIAPASSDQMFASARPSSLGKAGADFVSLKFFAEVRRAQDFHAEESIATRAKSRGVPRVSMNAE